MNGFARVVHGLAMTINFMKTSLIAQVSQKQLQVTITCTSLTMLFMDSCSSKNVRISRNLDAGAKIFFQNYDLIFSGRRSGMKSLAAATVPQHPYGEFHALKCRCRK